MKRFYFTSLVMGFTLVLSACGSGEVQEATFTSLVVQRDICTLSLNDDPEASEEEAAAEPEEDCSRYEVNTVLRYKIIEDSEKRVWIQGWALDGSPHRNWLGTRDAEGGFLFTREFMSENEGTGCVRTETQTLSLNFPYGVAGYEDSNGVCDHLEGRETVVVSSTYGCNESGPGTVRTIRKRWEEDPTCESEVSINFAESDD